VSSNRIGNGSVLSNRLYSGHSLTWDIMFDIILLYVRMDPGTVPGACIKEDNPGKSVGLPLNHGSCAGKGAGTDPGSVFISGLPSYRENLLCASVMMLMLLSERISAL
jgi:hypothetical protein